MDRFIELLRDNPVIPLFFTIGAGYWLGHLKYKAFSLGGVAATLIIGVLVGQLDIQIPQIVKTLFFMLFLFSIGYSVGPLFFRSFKGHGLKQLGFAVVEALICACTVLLAAKIMGYSPGVAGGLFAGSQTASASLGVMSETVRSMEMADSEKILSMLTACYAVTYVFGTIGSAWFLSNIGPMLLGGLKKVKEETKAIEEEMDSGDYEPSAGFISADRPVSFRAYRAEGDFFEHPRSVLDIEKSFEERGLRVFVERLRIRGKITAPTPKVRVRKGDTVVLSARREVMVDDVSPFCTEVADHELLGFGAESVNVTISKSGAAGLTFGELRKQPYMKGVIVSNIKRQHMSLPGRNKMVLQRGDILTLVGLPRDVNEAAQQIGYADRDRIDTDMTLLGLGVAIGCLVGAISIKFHGIPLSLSTSGGSLIAGLILGWLRDKRPTFGRIPSQVVWIFDNLGLNMFIAVIGITSGTTFLAGIKEVGIGLLIVGAICTMLALTVNIFIARHFFKFTSPETLGCVAGARCGVASIGAIQETLESNVPIIGYTVTYAAGNIILIFSSLIVLFLT